MSLSHAAIAGKERLVVFLGESHQKNAIADEKGKAVLEQFDNYGVEGADSSRLWGGRALDWTLDFLNRFHKKVDKAGTSHGSTIDKTAQRLRVLPVLKQLQETLKQKAPEKSGELAKLIVRIGDEDYPMSRLPELIASLEQGRPLNARAQPKLHNNEPDSGAPIQPRKTRTFELEAGHKPDLAENLGSALFPVFTVVLPLATASVPIILSYGLYQLSGHTLPISATAAKLGAIAIGLGLAYAATKIPERYNPTSLLIDRYLYWSFAKARNQTMVGNIINAFEKNEDLEILLAIVGRKHVDGISRILNERYAFQTIPFHDGEPPK